MPRVRNSVLIAGVLFIALLAFGLIAYVVFAGGNTAAPDADTPDTVSGALVPDTGEGPRGTGRPDENIHTSGNDPGRNIHKPLPPEDSDRYATLIGVSSSDRGMKRLAGARISIYDLEGNLVAEIFSNTFGEYSVRLPYGRYIIKTGAPEGAGGAEDSREVEIAAPIVREDFALAVPEPPPPPARPSELALKIVGRDSGRAVAGATIRIKNHPDEPFYDCTFSAASDGTFELALGPGKYILLVKAEGYKPSSLGASVKADRRTELTVKMRREILMYGRVIDKFTGRPVAGADIQIFSTSTQSKEGHPRSGEDGYYSASVRACRVWLRVQTRGYLNYVTKMCPELGDGRFEPPVIEVPPEGLKFDIELVPANSVLEVQVIDSVTRRPVPGAIIQRRKPGDNTHGGGRESDENGRRSIIAGESYYLVKVIHPDYEVFYSDWLRVGSNEVYEYEVLLKRKRPFDAIIRGRILDGNSKLPVVGEVEVEIYPEVYDTYSEGQWRPDTAAREAMTTGAAGYSFTLPEGGYVLKVRPSKALRPTVEGPGYAWYETSVVLLPGRELLLDIPLKNVPAFTEQLKVDVVVAGEERRLNSSKVIVRWDGKDIRSLSDWAYLDIDHGRFVFRAPPGEVTIEVFDISDPLRYRPRGDNPVKVTLTETKYDEVVIEMVPVDTEED